ncbi:competence type IV pilus assembly protein ComGB [Fundicoccus sp. Sow4_D5]|uniref:competence type IV pilus assembly protein ComGB n=1 Tax=unclassified Fundicoccus TaxID=2761543 RepID=UPI003F91EA3D
MATSTKKPILSSKLFNHKLKRLNAKQRAYLLITLADMLEEGFSINQSLVFMKLLMKPQAGQIESIIIQLQQGQSFERSIQELGYSVSTVAQLFYAQRQGRFIEALRATAMQMQQVQNYQQKIIKVITYPLIMGSFLIAMMFGMRILLLPHIMSFISQETYDSNVLVRLLVMFFNYLPQISLFLLSSNLIIYLCIDFYLLRLDYLDRYRLLLRFPFLSYWVRSYCSYKLSKELGYFFEGGYSLLQTVEVLTLYPIDPFLTEIAERLKYGLVQGEPLVEIIKDMNLFSIELPMVIYQGELTSQTAQKCKVYSDKLFHDLMEDVAKKIGYIQPFLFLVIAILILGMYLTIMLPMLTMEF